MKTYQDLLDVEQSGNELDKISFIISAIAEHKASLQYRIAVDSEKYIRQQNTTINDVSKWYLDARGVKVADNISSNFKIASDFLKILIVQEIQYSLGNGVFFNDPKTLDKLGGEDFYNKAQDAAYAALVDGAGYGYYNDGVVEIMSALDAVPLYDEENGSLSALIHFWQINSDKPLRVRLFEIDGMTEYIQRSGENMTVYREFRPYVYVVRTSEIGGREIFDARNYPTFPVVPCYGNKQRQAVLERLKPLIDAYDIILSGYANNLEDAANFYFIISNAARMNGKEKAEFLKDMREHHIVQVDDDGAGVQTQTVDVSSAARDECLDRIEGRIYTDGMGVNVREIATSGNVTAVGIKASFHLLDLKATEFEAEMRKFVQGLLAVVGITDEAVKFKRDLLINQSETVNNVLSSATVLDERTILEKLPFIDDDEVDVILERKATEEVERYQGAGENGGTQDINADEAVEVAEDVADKSLNGSQTRSLLQVISQYSSGTLTLGQAINIMTTSLGVTKEEAQKIIEGTE